MNDRCGACPRTNRCVPPDGPSPAKYLLIGEAPGREEDRYGKPFVGVSGQELRENYLNLAGLDPDEVRITNAVLCRPNQNKKPSEKETFECASWHLVNEIEATQPEAIFLLGATACSLLPSMSLDVEHGVPQWVQLNSSTTPSWVRTDRFDWSGWMIPMYHPASGLHDTGMMIPMLEDWEGLKPWIIDREWTWPEDAYPNPDYRLVRSVQEVDAYFKYRWSMTYCGVDTESHDGVQSSIQVSIRPGTGLMVMLDAQTHLSGTALNALGYWLPRYTLVFHHAQSDLPTVQSILHGDSFRYRDTMQEAYHLGNLPQKQKAQGLKSLGYRLCGVRMQSWEDLVLPYSKSALMEWMKAAIDLETGRPIRVEKQLKTKLKVTEKSNDEEKLLRHVLRYTSGNPEYDPWKHLEGMRSIDLAGPYPKMGIAHVPLKESIHYAVRDADITLRVALVLDRLRVEAENEWNVQPDDYDPIRIGSSA